MTLTTRQIKTLRRLHLMSKWHGMRGDVARATLRRFYAMYPNAPLPDELPARTVVDGADWKLIASGNDDADRRWAEEADGGAKW